MNSDDGRPWHFFALTFALSVPFWVFGLLVDQTLMPGLPVSSLMVVCPGAAALLLISRRQGRRVAWRFVLRAVDPRRLRAPLWLMVLLLMHPVLYGAAYLIQRASGIDLPPPQVQLEPVLILIVLFFLAALAEELGWTGYALGPLQRRFGMFGAALMIGVAWAIWHLVPLFQVGRSPDWMLWWALGTLAARVMMVWFYNHTGQSVLLIIVFHTLSNLSWQLYPIQGSFFDPRLDALLTIALTVLVLRPWNRRASGT